MACGLFTKTHSRRNAGGGDAGAGAWVAGLLWLLVIALMLGGCCAEPEIAPVPGTSPEPEGYVMPPLCVVAVLAGGLSLWALITVCVIEIIKD